MTKRNRISTVQLVYLATVNSELFTIRIGGFVYFQIKLGQLISEIQFRKNIMYQRGERLRTRGKTRWKEDILSFQTAQNSSKTDLY